jgi:hypothetical protein
MLTPFQAAGLTAIALCAGVTASPALASTNLVTNGYFSQPDPSTYIHGDWTESASIPGWTSNTTDTIETGLNSTYGLGSYLGSTTNLELNDNTWGSISQTITGLTVGETYDLTFGYGIRQDAGVQQMVVSIGGAPLGTLNAPNEPTSSWHAEYYAFTATAASEILTFTSNVTTGGNPAEGNELTAVSLTALPEPMTWALMLVGFAGIGGALRVGRRRLAIAA